MNTILLAYMAAAEKMSFYPTMMNIDRELPVHFAQEFALDARIYDRFRTYGAESEEEFLNLMNDGKYRGYSPNQYEVKFVLDQAGLAYFDYKGRAHNKVIQEVW